jgi:hypothetical protein
MTGLLTALRGKAAPRADPQGPEQDARRLASARRHALADVCDREVIVAGTEVLGRRGRRRPRRGRAAPRVMCSYCSDSSCCRDAHRRGLTRARASSRDRLIVPSRLRGLPNPAAVNPVPMPHLPTAWVILIAAYLLTQAAAGAPPPPSARREHLEHMARRIGLPLEDVTGELLLAYAGAQPGRARPAAAGAPRSGRSGCGPSTPATPLSTPPPPCRA